MHAVTLTGVGERVHLLTRAITLETHITDVVNAIEAEEMRDVVMAAHSYGGVIATAIADRLPGLLRHLIYVDAVLPEPGEGWSSTHPVETRESRRAAAEASSDYTLPPPDPAVLGLSGERYAWVKRRMTPHPAQTYFATIEFEPRRVAQTPRTYITCTRPRVALMDAAQRRAADPSFWKGAWQGGGGARVVEMAVGHHAVVIDPEGVARILLGCC